MSVDEKSLSKIEGNISEDKAKNDVMIMKINNILCIPVF